MNSSKTARYHLTLKRDFIGRFALDQTGGTAIEYALIIGLLALACVGAFSKVGSSSGGGWGNTANAVSTAMAGAK